MTITAVDPQIADIRQIEQFLYREARYADEHDYEAWESLWTDDAIYWVPANGADNDPLTQMSILYDNRSRISTRLKQLRTGKRYAQAPPSNMRRMVTNIEVLDSTSEECEVGANFVLLESRERGTEVWAGRTTYRIRLVDGELRLAFKKVVLVNNAVAVPTLGFLI